MTAPALGHGLSFNDLYDRDGLARLDAAFAGWLQTANVDVHARLMAARGFVNVTWHRVLGGLMAIHDARTAPEPAPARER